MSAWTRRQRSLVVGCNVVGLAAILAGWAWASGRTLPGDQLPLSTTVAGLVVAGLANVSWLLSGRRTLSRAKLALFGSQADDS